MKKNNLFLILLFILFGFLVGCSNMQNSSESIGSEGSVLDKVVFEKNREDCSEVMAIYFKGDNITKVETKETYIDKDALTKAYSTYSESTDYINLRTSGLDIGYEYSSSRIYNSFDGIRGKDKIIDELEKNRGYDVR